MSDDISFCHAIQDAYPYLGTDTINRGFCSALQALQHYTIESVGRGPIADSQVEYPIDSEGIAYSVNLLEDPAAVRSLFNSYGFVVVRDVVPLESSSALMIRAESIARTIAALRGVPETDAWWNHPVLDAQGAALFSRGFLEVNHDASWASLRQSPVLYLLSALLWGRPDVWTTFDRIGVKPPDAAEGMALPFHVDQNPLLDPEFCSLQGVLALSDCPESVGTTVVVNGSRRRFAEWTRYASPLPGKHYVQLDDVSGFSERAQPIPLRAGSILVWDSRLVHANSPNKTSDATRWVALVASGIAAEHAPELVLERIRSVQQASGGNKRKALMYASKNPRFCDPVLMNSVRIPESYTPLGELLYGIRSYQEVLS